MRVLLTAVAYYSYGAMLARPQIQWLLMGEDGSIRDPDGEKVTNENAQPDIAWGTSDLFREGAPLAPFSPSCFLVLDSAGSSRRPRATTARSSPSWWPME